MPELDALLRDLVGPAAQLDVERLRRSARARRIRQQAGAVLAALALLVPAAATLLWRDAGSPDPPVAAIPALDAEAARLEPARLPEGFARCAGPVAVGDLVTTSYCGVDGQILHLYRGPHAALDERGEPFEVAGRPGRLTGMDDRTLVTVSDRDSPDDLHYRLDAPANMDPRTLRTLLESIPGLAGGPG